MKTADTEEPKLSKKQKRDRKLSVWQKRALVLRVLSYAHPYRGAVIVAFMFAMIGSLVGTASLLPMIPVIKFVMTPDELREQSEDTQKSINEKKEELSSEILDGKLGFVEEVELYLSSQKDKIREQVYAFLLDQKEDAVKWIAVILVVAVIFKSLFEYISKYQITKVVFFGTQKMKIELYDSSINLDLAHLNDRTSANLMSRLNSDVAKVRIIYQSVLSQGVLTPFEVFFLIILLFIISPEITIITLIGLPILVVPLTIMSKTLRRLSKQDAEEDAYLMDVMQETIIGINIVKAFRTENFEMKRFRRVAKDQVKRQLKRTRLALAAPAFTDIITSFATAGVLIAGVYIVFKEQRMDPAEFIVYLFALSRLYKPLKGMSNTWMKLQRGLASAERVFEIMDSKPTVVEKPDAYSVDEISDKIEFKNVNFRYTEDGPLVLSNLNLSIPKGKVLAIVGETGSGKTTISRLIPRFYDPNEGEVLLDGHNLRDLTFKSLRDQIGLVTQDTILFDASIYDNIVYGRQGSSPAQVEQAARDANAHDFIEKLPEGYQTGVGERGGKLSGGQKQRIAIARAILRNAPILILDEATSALDNESQALVQSALERLMLNRTVIVIAHRLSTVRNADQIVVMQDGKISEYGTHEDLLQKSDSYYSRLFNQETIE